ncbi:inner membrane protein import complex subunit Tim54-domain-containing protein [Butyriboletus roseoflavus]|nr:inner membrane protein import complex subunit Tim54-domain-containing protein [Butyriboletus roseoflavus]
MSASCLLVSVFRGCAEILFSEFRTVLHSMDAPSRKSGVRAALEYTGIPASWLSARPRLPSRNWCIFITLTSSLVSYYAYDRHQARAIRRSYIDRVKHLADEPMKSTDLPRKVVVYGAKWPGDEDHQRAVRFFKKYVKVCAGLPDKQNITTHASQPVLVAAAIDYDIVATRHSGDLARRIASTVVKDRRLLMGVDQSAALPLTLPNQPTQEQKRARELEGGVVLIGRHTFKEYMAGLKRGWSGGLDLVDREEKLAQELASDGTFDETYELSSPPIGIVDDPNAEPIPTLSRLPPSHNADFFSPLKLPTSSKDQTPTTLNPSLIDSTPPATVPPQPPLLLVPCVNYVGFRFIPHMIWGFFNERHKTQIGCEAAYSLVINKTREFQGPSLILDPSHDVQPGEGWEASSEEGEESKITQGPPQGGDLDFGLSSESVLVPHSPVSNIASSRKSYYKALPERLVTARQLARGERAPTKEEEKNPPPSEVELRAERLNKELRWRGEEEAWGIVEPGSGVSWDARFRGVLEVFDNQGADDEGLGIDK